MSNLLWPGVCHGLGYVISGRCGFGQILELMFNLHISIIIINVRSLFGRSDVKPQNRSL